MKVFGQYPLIDLQPGNVHIAKEPTVVWTVLGSCVAIVFYNERLKIGAICHAQLAEKNHRDGVCSDCCPEPCYASVRDSNCFKYVACSLRYMCEQFAALDIPKHEITVKLFGGSNMFHYFSILKPIGDENIEVARKMIQQYGLQLAGENVGGTTGRTLYFYSDTGEVLLKVHKPNLFALTPEHPASSQRIA